MQTKKRYKLDNAANIYPCLMMRDWRPTFRCSAVLKSSVDSQALHTALHKTLPRFPYFSVQLKRNFFWHYLEQDEKAIVPIYETGKPFAPPLEEEPLFRVLYNEKSISVEMQHTLADGYGAMVFLKTLLAQYFIQKGIEVKPTHGVFDIDQSPEPNEIEDCYPRYSREKGEYFWPKKKAFQLKGKKKCPGNSIVTTGIMDKQEVLKKAHQYNASVTEYLSAILVQALYTLQKQSARKSRPVRVSITCDLRKYYPVSTLKIFSQFCNIGIDPQKGDWTFEEILLHMRQQCRTLFTEEYLNTRFSNGVRIENNALVRMLPLFIKDFFLLMGHRFLGEREFTTNFTNLGVVQLPEAISGEVERFETTGNNFRTIKLECGVVSYGDCFAVSFSRAIDLPQVETLFFKLLGREGICVQIESNEDSQTNCAFNPVPSVSIKPV